MPDDARDEQDPRVFISSLGVVGTCENVNGGKFDVVGV